MGGPAISGNSSVQTATPASTPGDVAPAASNAPTAAAQGKSNSLRERAARLSGSVLQKQKKADNALRASSGHATPNAASRAQFAQPNPRQNQVSPADPYDLKKFVQAMEKYGSDASYLHAFYARTHTESPLGLPFNTDPRELETVKSQLKLLLSKASEEPLEQLTRHGIHHDAKKGFRIQNSIDGDSKAVLHNRSEDEAALHLLLERHFEVVSPSMPSQSHTNALPAPFSVDVIGSSDEYLNPFLSIGSHADELVELDARLVANSHFHKKIASTGNNCWMRAAWAAALHQHASNQQIPVLKAHLTDLLKDTSSEDFSKDIDAVCDHALQSPQEALAWPSSVEKSMQRLSFALLNVRRKDINQFNTDENQRSAEEAANQSSDGPMAPETVPMWLEKPIHDAVYDEATMGRGDHVATLMTMLHAECIILVKNKSHKNKFPTSEQMAQRSTSGKSAVMHADRNTGEEIFALEEGATGDAAIEALAANLRHRPIIFQDNINNHLHFDLLVPR